MTHKNGRKKISHRFKLLRSYLKRNTTCPGLPIFVTISPTSRCNLKCPMCPRAISEFSDTDIDSTLFQKIVEEGAPYFQFVYLMGGGEPLLNNHLFEMVRECKAKDFRTGFSTNATLLRHGRIDDVFESGLDYIILAFDGATPEVYEKYRPGARFDTVRNNILRFLKRKRERHSRIWVTIQMVRLPANESQIPDFKKLWNVKGVNDIRIKEDEIGIEGVCLDERNIPRPRRNPCHFLWQGPIYIDETGGVYPCCYMWDMDPVGNVQEQTLQEIWSNDAMQALRKAHADGDLSDFPECVQCKAPRPRLPLIVGSFLINTFRVRRLIPFIEKLSLRYKISLFEDRK